MKSTIESKIKIFVLILGLSIITYVPLAKVDTPEYGSQSEPRTSSDSLIETLIPEENIQTQWDHSDFNYIINAGGQKNYHSGFSSSATDIYGMNSTSTERPIDEITIYVLCACDTMPRDGYSKLLVSYRFGDTGEWSSVKSVSSIFSKTWKQFTWNPVLQITKEAIDELQVRLVAEINTYRYEGAVLVDQMYVETTYIASQKIGIFFWASDAGHDCYFNGPKINTLTHIEAYKEVLYLKGYTKFFTIFDKTNSKINATFKEIADYEKEDDVLFFYFWGHGYHDYDEEHSYVKLNHHSGSEAYKLWDTYDGSKRITLKDKLSSMDSQRIGFLVESCHSGGFVTNFATPEFSYLTISSSHISFNSVANGYSHEGYFSHYFFTDLFYPNRNAFTAFNYASMMNFQDPIWYNFGNGLQFPCYDNNLYDDTGYMHFA